MAPTIPSPAAFTINQQQGEKIQDRLNYRLSRSISHGIKFWIPTFILPIIPAVAILIYHFTTNTDGLSDNVISTAFIGYCLGFVLSMFCNSLVLANANRILLSRAKQMQTEQSVQINDKGIKHETEFGSSHLNWSGLGPVEYDDGMLLIYTGDCCSIFVPDDAFSSNQDAIIFGNYCQEKAKVKQ